MAITVGDVKQYLKDRLQGKSGKLSDDVMNRAIPHAIRTLAGYCEWSFYRKTAQIASTAEYTTGYVDMTHASAAVVGSGTTFVAGHANQLLIPSTQNRGYTISAYNSATSLTLEAPFIADDAANDEGIAYRIVYRDVALPSDFRDLEEAYLSGDSTQDRLLSARIDRMDEDWALRPNSGEPRHYTVVRSVTNGADTYKLRLYPASSKAKAITIVYLRWPTEPTVTSDAAVFDWPDKYRDALFAACLLAVTEDAFSDLRSSSNSDFMRVVDRAKQDDQRHAGPVFLGGDGRRRQGHRLILHDTDRT